jgi:hypothetical protein
MKVMRFEHRGIAGALPPAQVATALASGVDEGAPPLRLWDGSASAAEDASQLIVTTGVGTRRLSCSAPRLTTLAERTEQLLPPLLSRLVGLAHVVGCARDQDGSLVWLVDLQRVTA